MSRVEESELISQYKNKTILITGGNGYLASNIIRVLKDVECTVIRLTRTGRLVIPMDGICKIVDIQGDLQTPKIWEEALDGVDIVYHFAAQTSTYVANANPVEDIQANVLPLLQLLETCKNKNWCPIVCFAGSVTVTGIPQQGPVDETHPDFPVTIYDLHKQMAENYLKYYVSQRFVKGVALRLPNIYGPGPKSSSADRGILNAMMRRALKGEHLTVYGTGEELRDYLHVDDAVRAFLLAPVYINKINGEHIVLGTGEGHSIAQTMHLIADRVKQKVGKSVSVAHIEAPTPQSPIEFRNFISDFQKFNKATGWSPSYSLKEGIDWTLDYYLREDKACTRKNGENSHV
jgi:UDP-glucose 4-epimerase